MAYGGNIAARDHRVLVLDLDLSNQSRGSGRIVLERGDKLLLGLVVANKTMDFRLDENEAELGVFILAIDFKMLPYGNRLLDEVPKVLRDGWAKSYPQTRGIDREFMVERKRKRGV